MALQIPKIHMNILLIPKIHRWSRQLVSTWRSSRGWCLPPRPPPPPRAPLSFQAWLAFAGGTSQHHQRIRCLPLRGRSQHHQPILGVCNLYLIMVCALIQLCMLAIPSIIPLGKRDLEDFAFESLFGDPKKDSVFHLDIVVASDWLFAFLRRHLDVFLILWRDYFHAKYLLLIFRKIQKLQCTNESLNQFHKYNLGSPHSAPLSIPFNFCQQDLATTGNVLSNLHS